MKKITLACILAFSLTSCLGYESLETPFTFRGDENAVEKLGITDGKSSSAKNLISGYQVSINAPAGTPMETAYSILNKEAARVCRGGTYNYEVKSEGDANKMQANPQDTGNQKYPYLTAVVVCAENSPIAPTENIQTSQDLTRSANSISAPIRANTMKSSNNRGSSIQGRTIQTNNLDIQDLLVPQENIGY